MISGNFISFKVIVAKLYRDLQLKEEENFTDILEWCAEALDFIHVYPQYETKPYCAHINNYKAELPCDYKALEAIEHEGHSILPSSNLFGPQDNSRSNRYLTPYSYNQKKIENVLLVEPGKTYLFSNRDSFQISNGYIKTSFKEGHINILYRAIILDEEGYPMIPDEQSFKEAIFWYCNYKRLYVKALNNEINPKFYEDAYRKWQWYCNQAGAEALMPDLTMLESLKRSFLSLKPELHRSRNFFDGLNKNI